ncbi:RNA 2',3'-cyclic phosphodiesterase [Miltoncostaea marina]|uniref:RNA 2',3'-cyclic phosphodiesterase n=1 Tax=Miltoncostaea marina TaxID=2843215 RepID=UPI001C3E1AAD|nr:RNA 2',3'-cyclic phosphodiesterase [Miltoncostaea marina]
MDAVRPVNRLFVAAELPAAARERAAALGREVAGRVDGRAVPAASLHVTLEFLGPVPADRVPALAEAVTGAAAGPPARVAPAALRARPRAARARLVALELADPDGVLAAMAGRVRGAADRALGRAPSAVAFWPHVTIVRLRRPARVAGLPAVDGERLFDISRAALYDSVQSPGGPPEYRELAAVELSPAR